jgi:NAD(P) transhydrogenase subunit alpha
LVRIGVPREVRDGERRVALVPEVVATLVADGHDVLVEAGAGLAAGFADDAFADADAMVVPAAQLHAEAHLLLAVQRPTAEQLAAMRPGVALAALLSPLAYPAGMRAIAERRVTALSLDQVPRITRAQGMDALSSQATVSGYKAVLLAAAALPRFFPLLMTAAGTVRPARVLVLGAGVAGLQAIATARRLGGVVSAFDTRAVVREQVESLGARFLEIDVEDAEGEGGYATELSEEAHRLEQELVARHVADSDVVITTALVPGRRAPILITADSVAAMRAGSVIVDLAAEAGGNCEVTNPGHEVHVHGVSVIGPVNLPSTMAWDASTLYARNVAALARHLAPERDLVVDDEDEITRGALITRDGAVVHQATLAQMEALAG